MTIQVLQWSLVVHIFGFVLWTGSLLGLLQMMSALDRTEGAAREPLLGTVRRAAVLADIGALVAIASGLWLALGGGRNMFTGGGWLHAKLMIVVVFLLATHVLLRIKVGRHRRGKDTGPVPGFLLPLVLGAIFAVVVLPILKPF